MSAPAPRLRMFAGPNGSGKSTIKDILPDAWLGMYINADDMERSIRAQGFLDLSSFGTDATGPDLQAYLRQSAFLRTAGLAPQVDALCYETHRVVFGKVEVNSYFASVLADFIRHRLLASQASFTFETVMSSDDKVDFLQKAQRAGYRTYLYYVATEDADINVARVQHRVRMGGHAVSEDKIRSRYVRSLQLLPQAVAYSDRAFIFDNSGHDRLWVAEVTNGIEMELKTDPMPAWFKSALWDTFDSAPPLAPEHAD